MSEVLKDLSTAALITAIKNNLYQFFRQFQHWDRADFYESPLLVRWQTPVLHPWFNAVHSLQSPPDNAAMIIQETQAYFRARQVPGITWWFAPHLHSAGWGSHLQRHGFTYDNNTPGMAMALARLPETVTAPTELVIRPVEDADTLKVWTHVFRKGFEFPEDWEPDLQDMMASICLDPPVYNYLGTLDGQPVATSTLLLEAGVAGIYNVATLPAARGRGIGAALTLAPLHQAHQMGYQAGILQSSAAGFGVYQRLGFQKLCTMEHYYWNAGQPAG
jgi:ribosomal protein S18 acetylase RimI-like enzyme